MKTKKRGELADWRIFRLLVIVAGIIFGQAVLYGPCLLGQKILLPLDFLAAPGIYIPQTAETAGMMPHDKALIDLALQFEPARRFATSEIHQGRFPLWAPYQYGGVPFVWPKYSLFLFLECCVKSPVILAWVQLLAALIAGGGMYFFSRQTLHTGFWPAAVCAWCYPLTAFFVLWQGFPTGLAVCWLPWLFLCVDKTVRGGTPLSVIGLGLATFLVLTGGHVDVGGQVLLGSGLFAIWSLWDSIPVKMFFRKTGRTVAMLLLGWGLGFFLAAPHLLPLLEYAETGSRIEHRSAGKEERPPVGVASLPEILLPDIYGTTARGSVRIGPPAEANLVESASAGYAGVLAALLVAPLAFCGRRRRAINLFWVFLALLGLSWCADVPGFVNLLRLPLFNMMSHNRLVFLTAFAVLCLAATGLENLLSGPLPRRWWFCLPAALLAGLCGWCIYRSLVLPSEIATQNKFNSILHQGGGITYDLRLVQVWFISHYRMTAVFCGLGFAGWVWLWFQKTRPFLFFPLLVVFLLGDLLWFDNGRSAECDPELYYPKISVLSEVADSLPGRVIGAGGCLPASLALMGGLRDIRGYDSIDPARMVDLLKTTEEPGPEPDYASVQYLRPKGSLVLPGSVLLAPVLDMLNVRYVIRRGVPPELIHPVFQGNDYWVLINSNALPRPFVPRSVETVASDIEELNKLSSDAYKPAEIAYVQQPVELPKSCRGTAQITNETPTRITMSVQMETPGLVVLADNWDKGWRAYYNGKSIPVLRANYAVRGVIVPAGNGKLEFIYKPASLVLGLWLAALAAMVIACWIVIIRLPQLKTARFHSKAR